MARFGITRREFVGAGAAAGMGALLLGCGARQSSGRTPVTAARAASASIGYFAAFGVDERLIRETLAAAMARGGDYADLYFQHRVATSTVLEDGKVNKAFTNVELGVGVRVVKGDQTGYAYTEDVTLEAMRSAAATAASIADGPSRRGPTAFHQVRDLPQRYAVRVGWDAVAPEKKLPILEQLNAATFAADQRIVKVNVAFSDEHGAILLCDSQGRMVEDRQ